MWWMQGLAGKIDQQETAIADRPVPERRHRLPLSLFTSFPRSGGGARPGGANGTTRLWLWALILAGAIGPLFLLLDSSAEIPFGPRLAGGLLWVLAWLPTIVYFASPPGSRPPIPFLAMLGVFFALYFPLQLLMGLANVNDLVSLDAGVHYHRPAQLALIGWTALLVGYVATVITWPRRSRAPAPAWSTSALKPYAFAMLLGGMASDIVRPLMAIPATVNGILAFVSILSTFGAGVLLVLARRGRLTHSERTAFWVLTAVMIVVQMGTGSVATFARTGVILILAAWVGGAKLRASIIAVALVFAAVVVTFRGFVIEYRLHTWWGGEQVSHAQRAALWWKLISDHAAREGVVGTVGHGTYVVATRSATLDLYADVVQRTPRSIPHWNGRTYHSLVGAFVPRILWPDKPPKLVGNQFGHRYSYLSPDDRHTSINLPTPIEFYVNFGENGVLFGMTLLGVVMAMLGRVLNRPGQDWVRSLAGVVLLVPVVTNLESDFSLVFGGLILDGFALFVVYRVLIRRCTAEAAPEPAPQQNRGYVTISGLMHPTIATPAGPAAHATAATAPAGRAVPAPVAVSEPAWG